MGNWILSNVHCSNLWPAYCHHWEQAIYITKLVLEFGRVNAPHYQHKLARVSRTAERTFSSTIARGSIPADFQIHQNTTTFRFNRDPPVKQSSDTVLPIIEPWKTPLISGLHIFSSNAIIEAMGNKETTIHTTTDGGVYDYKGTFGVVISDGNKSLA
jgi:hypothetical protein